MERGVGAQGNTEAMSLKQVRRVKHPIYPVSSYENDDAPYGSYNHVKSEAGWQRS